MHFRGVIVLVAFFCCAAEFVSKILPKLKHIFQQTLVTLEENVPGVLSQSWDRAEVCSSVSVRGKCGRHCKHLSSLILQVCRAHIYIFLKAFGENRVPSCPPPPPRPNACPVYGCLIVVRHLSPLPLCAWENLVSSASAAGKKSCTQRVCYNLKYKW